MRQAAGAALLVLALGVLGAAQAQQRGDHDAFAAGKAAGIVDGSFAIGSIRVSAKFDWGVAPLPRRTSAGTPSNFGSFWVPGLTTCAQGAQRDAVVKFPKFITPADTHRLRLQQTENPGRPPSCPYWPCSWCCIDRS